MKMKKNFLLILSLTIFSVIAVVYGFLYALWPQVMVDASGSDPVPSGWLRWAGAIMFALGIGSVIVLRKPSNQGIFVTTLALGTLLCGLALIYSSLFELAGIGNIWHTLLPGIVIVLLSVLLWVCLNQYKALLFEGEV